MVVVSQWLLRCILDSPVCIECGNPMGEIDPYEIEGVIEIADMMLWMDADGNHLHMYQCMKADCLNRICEWEYEPRPFKPSDIKHRYRPIPLPIEGLDI